MNEDNMNVVAEQVDDDVIIEEKDGSIIASRKVTPFKVELKIDKDNWERNGTIWQARIEVPELRENGISKAYPNEPKMKEENRNMTITMKIINDIFDNDMLEAHTEEGLAVFDWISNKSPGEDIYIDIEQLPFD